MQLRDDIPVMTASNALLHKTQATYVQITINSHSLRHEELRQAGFLVTDSTWDVVMAKSLVKEVSIDDLRERWGLKTAVSSYHGWT